MNGLNEHRIAYLHGMGGGSDSRIPSLLKTMLPDGICLQVRTYDFDPEVAYEQIEDWLSGFKPDLVIGESLGALHALRVADVPRILVSPALGAPFWMKFYSLIALIPGVTALLDRKYKPREGDRQKLHFTRRTLKKYSNHGKSAMAPKGGSVFAFFGNKDHYLKWKVVSIGKYKKLFGNRYAIYDGTHFMEEEYVKSMLLPQILETLSHLH
ncbi:MAG: hypothetical protein IJ151_07015 [Bacteroidales bacterium]|nr:hypothetical protein [Bacteroidales bacterium]